MNEKIIGGNKRKLFNPKTVVIISGVLLLFFIFGIVRETINRRVINKEIEKYENQIAQLKLENERSGELINSWDQSLVLEREARLKLGLQKPGEKSVLIIRKNGSSGQTGIVSTPEGEMDFIKNDIENIAVSNPQKWLDYFFKK